MLDDTTKGLKAPAENSDMVGIKVASELVDFQEREWIMLQDETRKQQAKQQSASGKKIENMFQKIKKSKKAV